MLSESVELVLAVVQVVREPRVLLENMFVLVGGYPIGFPSVNSVEVGRIIVHRRFTDVQDVVFAHSALGCPM